MGFTLFPLIVGWELTRTCNIRCRHCASAAGQPRRDELTPQEALDLCDQLPALAVQEVDFTGGEPLLREDWPQIAARLAERGITTHMVTNGLLLTQDVVRKLRAVGLATVGVSLDGLEATHDAIRGRSGLFRSVLAGIDRAVGAGLNVGVITAVNAKNLPDLPALEVLLRSHGVKHWQVQPNLPQGRAREAPDLWLSTEEYVELGRFRRRVAHASCANGFKIVPADSLGYFTDIDLADPPWRGCPAGLCSVGITSDGKVKGCLSLPDTVIEGDLRQRDLWDIWFDQTLFPYTRQFSLDRLGPLCSGCEMAEQCKGGCTSMSLGCTGDVHNDPYCFLSIAKRAQQKATVVPSNSAPL